MRSSIVGIRSAIFAGLLLACVGQQVLAQSGPASNQGDPNQLALSGGYYALVIGINDYSPPLPKLATAVADARSIAQVLGEKYGFQVKLLLDQDATRSNILRAIAQYRNRLTENDSLLIYYAGHGLADRRADKAYWIPVDADSVDSPNRIIADEITTDVRVQSARHVLIISDSCYSGGLTRGVDAPVQSAGQAAFLNRMLKSRSRTLMSSGGDEPVADGGPDGHSVFAEALIRALQDTDQDTYTGVDLFYGYLRQRVAGNSSQVPQYVPIRDSGHDDGDFVFVRKAGKAPAATFNVAEAWAKSKALTDANRWAEAFPILEQLCSAGDPRGCMNLGLAYSNGAGVARDRGRSAELFRQVCAAKDPLGCNALGYSYANGMGVEKDLVRAAQLYRQSCDGSVAIGCYHLGVSYEDGLGLERDPVRAAEFYRRACDGKKANACASLGRLYSTGTGVAKDPAESAKYYGFGCNLDDARSCHELAVAYSSGLGVAKDQFEADRLLRKACGLGWNGCSVTEPQ